MMSTETDELIEVEDLDLLDDAHRHARCTYCQPKGPGLLNPFEALCGVRAVYLTGWNSHTATPPDACGACEEAWNKPCRRCGI
jgi:hypothetical protein